MSGISTYNPSVRVGNWSEDLYLEEVIFPSEASEGYKLSDFINRIVRGRNLGPPFIGCYRKAVPQRITNNKHRNKEMLLIVFCMLKSDIFTYDDAAR